MKSKKEKKVQLITEDARKILREDFSQMEEPVNIFVFTDGEENKPYNEFTINFARELAEISGKIRPVFERLGGQAAAKYDVSRSPTVLVEPDKYDIRIVGAPSGEEARTLVIGILMASTGRTILSEESRERLKALKDKRNVKVFVSPTCPYCPQQAAEAIAVAIEKKGLVTAEIIEIFENKDLASQFNALSVPQTFINDQLVGQGLLPEEVFIEVVVTAGPVVAQAAELPEMIEKDLVIIGAGPAGLTAAIYAERSGLKSVVIDQANIGGQVAVTPVVENYPGYTRIGGKTLMDMMAQQAAMYTDIHEGEEVLDIVPSDGLFKILTTRTKYTARAVLVATGVESKKLGIPGEKQFQGRGVSYCAACDGYFFKDGKKVIVVGGGNTAATEALYLKSIGVDVTLVHRRDRLRAEKYLQEGIENNKIPILWNTVVKEIQGEKLVRAVVLENRVDSTQSTVQVDGVFVAIGYVPKNDLAKKLGVTTNEEGYLKVDSAYRTNVKGVYAAGDITDGFKQIVTAVGQAAVAANAIFEDLSNPYWKQKREELP